MTMHVRICGNYKASFEAIFLFKMCLCLFVHVATKIKAVPTMCRVERIHLSTLVKVESLKLWYDSNEGTGRFRTRL